MVETYNNRQQRRKDCLVFMTHILDGSILGYISYLQKEVCGLMDVIVLYDCAHNPIEKAKYPTIDFHFFNSKELPDFFFAGQRVLPNPLIALIEFASSNNYEHYLLMENDIVLNGCFRRFAERVINCDANTDYVHIATDILGGPQAHWPIKYIEDNPFEHIYFAWCQLFFVSQKFISKIGAFIKSNTTFYYEFLLPTFAYNRHFCTHTFEELGYVFHVSWGPAQIYERIYQTARTPNTFYHPVKHLNTDDFKS